MVLMQSLHFTYGSRARTVLVLALGSLFVLAVILGGATLEVACNCDILRNNRPYLPRSSKDMLDSLGGLGVLAAIAAYVLWGAALQIRLLSDVLLDDDAITWLALGRFWKRELRWSEIANVMVYQTRDAQIFPARRYQVYSLQRDGDTRSPFAYRRRGGPIVVTERIGDIQELRRAINYQLRKRSIPVFDCREKGKEIPVASI
jgi:hypothetical protein